MMINSPIIADIRVGFNRNFTSVQEDVGNFELCVEVLTDPAFFPTHTGVDFSLDLITISGTAGMTAFTFTFTN